MNSNALDDVLFASNNTPKYGIPLRNFNTFSKSMPSSAKQKSDNETHDDLAGLIQGIPVPNDDELCHGSVDSAQTSESTTPQKPCLRRPLGQGIRCSSAIFEQLDNRPPSSEQSRSEHSQTPQQLNFENNMTIEELASLESPSGGIPNDFIDWSKKNIILGTGRFPIVEAASIDLSGNDFLHQSKRNVKKKDNDDSHFTSYEKENQNLRNALERITDELQRMHQHIGHLNDQIRDQNEENATVREEHESDKAKLVNLTAYMDEMNEEAHRRIQQIEDGTREIEELQKARGKLFEQEKLLNQEVEAWRQKYTTLSEQAAKSKDLKDKKLLDIEAKYQKITAELSNKTEQLKKLEGECKQLRVESKQSITQKEEHWEQLKASLNKKVEALEHENKALLERTKILKQERDVSATQADSKEKVITQKNTEMRNLLNSNKVLEESKQLLIDEVERLKLIVQQSEENTTFRRLETTQNEIALNQTLSHYNEGEATRETERLKGDIEYVSKGKQNLERLLTTFSEREVEFGNIKQNFIDKTIVLNDKIEYYKQHCSTLTAENDSLMAQVNAYKEMTSTLNEKIVQLENKVRMMDQKAAVSSSEALDKTKARRNSVTAPESTRRMSVKELGAEFESAMGEVNFDELKPPANYEENPLKHASFNAGRGGHLKKSKANCRRTKVVEEVGFNVLDMISPEMLSTEETILLMLGVLRRMTESHKLSVQLGRDVEFRELTNVIKKRVALEDMSSYNCNANTMNFKKSGRKH